MIPSAFSRQAKNFNTWLLFTSPTPHPSSLFSSNTYCVSLHSLQCSVSLGFWPYPSFVWSALILFLSFAKHFKFLKIHFSLQETPDLVRYSLHFCLNYEHLLFLLNYTGITCFHVGFSSLDWKLLSLESEFVYHFSPLCLLKGLAHSKCSMNTCRTKWKEAIYLIAK